MTVLPLCHSATLASTDTSSSHQVPKPRPGASWRDWGL